MIHNSKEGNYYYVEVDCGSKVMMQRLDWTSRRDVWTQLDSVAISVAAASAAEQGNWVYKRPQGAGGKLRADVYPRSLCRECMPHSRFSNPAHRPARGVSPGWMARVQCVHPTLG